MTTVKVENLTKKYGEIVALDKVSFEIKDKEYLAIIGPSGCGKTTLIKCMSGIQSPTGGDIYFDGKPVKDLPLEERGIGYVFQEIALFPHMNVWDNVTYGPRVKGWPGDRAAKVARELFELIRLSVREREYPSSLSGGARQKIGIARALASGSDLLFLDEPLGSLDAKVRTELRYEIQNIIRDLGLTAVHITHDQEEAMSVADRIAVMKAGRIVEIDEPSKLYSNPETLFVSNFVGEANFLEGIVTKVTDDTCLVESQGLSLSSTEKSKREGEKIVVAIRPDFVSMEKRVNNGEGFAGYIENQDFEGSTIRYEVVLKDHRLFTIRLPQILGGLAFNIGDEVNLSVKPEHVLIYPYPEVGVQKELALA
ncbi:MAG: hypothetical protein QG670_38 [Thermoproteota archaeon]|nr:hypothetical protein [Thermoproteota archaeon]